MGLVYSYAVFLTVLEENEVYNNGDNNCHSHLEKHKAIQIIFLKLKLYFTAYNIYVYYTIYIYIFTQI